MIGIIDYGAGNMGSLSNALNFLDIECKITAIPEELESCEKLILPGVGAFGPAMNRLDELNLSPFIRNWALGGKPLLGICLGMQLLLTESEEEGRHRGLDLIPGVVRKLEKSHRAIHTGWNRVKPGTKNNFITSDGFAYFVHGYACRPEDKSTVIGETEYGEPFASALQKGSVLGLQFHPEKSQTFGLNLLRRFAFEIL